MKTNARTIRRWLVATVAMAILVVNAGSGFAQNPLKMVTLELQPAEPLPQQLLTFNTDMATAIMFRGVGYDSPQFEDAVRQLRPQGLRFPGGTLANNYLWSKDSFSEPTNDKTGWAAEQLQLFRKIGRPYDLPGFARVARRNHVSPIWVLNVYEESPESVLELFEELDSLGLKVTITVEIFEHSNPWEVLETYQEILQLGGTPKLGLPDWFQVPQNRLAYDFYEGDWFPAGMLDGWGVLLGNRDVVLGRHC